MEQYAYLLLAIYFLAIAVLILLFRRELRLPGLVFMFVIAMAARLYESWFVKDYWLPPSFNGSQIGLLINDMMAAAGMMVVALFGYGFISGTSLSVNRRQLPHIVWFFTATFTVLIVCFVLFSSFLNINAIVVSIAFNLCLAGYIFSRRPELIRYGLASSLTLLLVSIPAYVIIFGLLAPQFWAKYWLLYRETGGWFILPGLPLTEALWYIALGLFAAPAYLYARDKSDDKTSSLT